MNTFRCPKLLVCEMYSPFFKGTTLETFKNNISAVASSALNALHASYEAVAGKKNEPEALYLRKHPMNEKERELFQICASAVQATEKWDDETLIQQARNLIREGVDIPSLFETIPLRLVWLRMHCAEELCERAAISKKGLELIDFETLLPPDWQPPDWLSPPQELENSQDRANQMPTKTFIEEVGNKLLCIRKELQPLVQELIEIPNISYAGFGISLGLLFCSTLQQVKQDQRIALVFFAIAFALSAQNQIDMERLHPSSSLLVLLNKSDMERLHKKALQNPLYETLWKNVENTNPTSLEFVDASKFLRPGLSISDVPKAHCLNGKIEIYYGLTERQAFEALIFESANAFQHNRFNEVHYKFLQGQLLKEEYVRLMEYVEWETSCIFHKIMDSGIELHGWPEVKFICSRQSTFQLRWEYMNIRSSKDKKDSHSDHYRSYYERAIILKKSLLMKSG